MRKLNGFRRIVTKSPESLPLHIFRPVETYTATQAVKEELQFTGTTLGMWNPPKELLQMDIEGRFYTVEGVFYLLPEIDIRQNDYLVRVDRIHSYRVIAIRDFLSHLQVYVIAPDENMVVPLVLFGLEGNANVVDGFMLGLEGNATIEGTLVDMGLEGNANVVGELVFSVGLVGNAKVILEKDTC